MKSIFLLLALPCLAQPPATVSFAAQKSPTPLPEDLGLYAIQVCGTSTRVVSGAQIFDAASSVGLSYQSPVLYPALNAKTISSTPSAKLLSAVKWGSGGLSIGSGVLSYAKTQNPSIGNAPTWIKVSVVSAALSFGLTLAQPLLQQNVNTQQAVMSSGVQAALIADSDLFTIPAAGGCAVSGHSMLYAAGKQTGSKGVIQ